MSGNLRCGGSTYVSVGLAGDDGPFQQVAECNGGDLGDCGWRVVMSEYTGVYAPDATWDTTVDSDEFLPLHEAHLAHSAGVQQ